MEAPCKQTRKKLWHLKVHVFFVDVANIESSMQMLINNLKVIYE